MLCVACHQRVKGADEATVFCATALQILKQMLEDSMSYKEQKNLIYLFLTIEYSVKTE